MQKNRRTSFVCATMHFFLIWSRTFHLDPDNMLVELSFLWANRILESVWLPDSCFLDSYTKYVFLQLCLPSWNIEKEEKTTYVAVAKYVQDWKLIPFSRARLSPFYSKCVAPIHFFANRQLNQDELTKIWIKLVDKKRYTRLSHKSGSNRLPKHFFPLFSATEV